MRAWWHRISANIRGHDGATAREHALLVALLAAAPALLTAALIALALYGGAGTGLS
jgi:Flp pilus assembly pilin Flp